MLSNRTKLKMSSNGHGPEVQPVRRIRQACTTCRQRKTKCSGDRPRCNHCRQSNRSCQYEPYSATTLADNSALLQANLKNLDLLQRISTIESKLAELSAQKSQDSRVMDGFSASPDDAERSGFDLDETFGQTARDRRHSDTLFRDSISRGSYNQSFNALPLPPQPIVQHLVDTYFSHVHNQPYAYFHENTFRGKLSEGLLPPCLILSVLASALRFSNHEYYKGHTHEAINSYARKAWLSVLADHMTAENCPSLHVVQTTHILAIIDFTAGRTSSGWLKIGLAVRISQDLQLMKEPSEWLSVIEQEERRRVFWSVYLLDKLVSCGRARPPAIYDEDCQVQLPCDEHTFRAGTTEKIPTLNNIFNWNNDLRDILGHFTLVILAASVLGRCARYMLHERETEDILPWDSRSEFGAINSSLLVVESYLHPGSKAIREIGNENLDALGMIDQQILGHIVFSRTLFHLCHCLLNHPFLLRLRLRKLSTKPPSAFLQRSLQASCHHASNLCKILDEAVQSECRIEASFYAYAATVSGGILSLNFHAAQEHGVEEASDVLNDTQTCLKSLESLGNFWGHASKMYLRLLDFHLQAHMFTVLFDENEMHQEMDDNMANALWSVLDYSAMSSEVESGQFKPGSARSPSFSELEFNFDGGVSSMTHDPSANETVSNLVPGFNFSNVDFMSLVGT